MKAKVLLSLAVAVFVLGAAYALLKPQRSAEIPQALVPPPPPINAQPEPRQPPSSSVAGANSVIVQRTAPNIYDIVVQRGRRISDSAVFKVHQGEDVKFRITSDVADEFHLHGYNLAVQVSPERTATLEFSARLTGRFTYELHKSELELGALEVYPR